MKLISPLKTHPAKNPAKKLLLAAFLAVIMPVLPARQNPVKVGAECADEYLPLLKDKKVAVLSNHTGMAGREHVVDLLQRSGVNVVCIFSPEHGFRGNAGAGERVGNSTDEKTGIPIKSLYDGKDRKPSPETMRTFDIVIFDIQDVGLRYYTYYITMVRMMDACAGAGKKMIVLDRPNPNGHYVDGPILDMKYKSGVGWLPIPVVHGMTLGEIARMTNGEKWLPENRECDLTVITCKNYTHKTLYQLPVPPSPNLPDMKSVYLYPSICYFEGTPVSLGRGTPFPFQVYGHPGMTGRSFSFTPRDMPGARNPPQRDKLCNGVDLRNLPDELIWKNGVDLSYVIDAYNNLGMGDHFFNDMFEKLIGVDYVRKMIKDGKSAQEIKARWKDDVENFKKQRAPYLLYAK
jgi:uncharacterized protein YbbC (DUF1343 family)